MQGVVPEYVAPMLVARAKDLCQRVDDVDLPHMTGVAESVSRLLCVRCGDRPSVSVMHDWCGPCLDEFDAAVDKDD
jgi:hypothetical protein